MTKIIFIFILLISIIILTLYIINRHLSTKEHYLTYFLPYYDKNLTDITKLYLNEDERKNFFKKKFLYDKIIIGYNKFEKNYIKLLSNFLIAGTFIQNIQYFNLIDYNKSLNDLNNNNIEFLITSIPTVLYYKNKENNYLKNIRYGNKLYNNYIYFFSKKDKFIYSMKNISRKFKVGIFEEPNIVNFYIVKTLKDFGYSERDYQLVRCKENYEDLFNLLINNEVDIIIFNDTFPNETVKVILDNNVEYEIILLPFDTNDEQLFLNKNFHLYIENIDLNLLSLSYLPKKFNNIEYVTFRPNIKILAFDLFLFTNVNVPADYVYNFTKYIFENKYTLNKYSANINFKIGNLMFKENELQIFLLHQGAQKYLVEKSYISYNPNPICQYFVGVMECNEKNIKNNIVFNS